MTFDYREVADSRGSWRGAPRSPARVRALAHLSGPPECRDAAPDSSRSPRWFAAGDVNGFLGLALDNTTNLVILSSLLIGVLGFPADLVSRADAPGLRSACWSAISPTRSWPCASCVVPGGRRHSDALRHRYAHALAMVFGVLGPVKWPPETRCGPGRSAWR
jgi:hypothetical protein